MKIISVELTGYRRFSLNAATNFKLTPRSLLQIILGTNGSGKSSLLEAASPFPQPKSDYIKGGCRILEIEHNNNHYRLVTTYNGGAKHRFEKNGEENNLNPGGTSTVQKDLVESELGITSQLHDLFTGQTKFTEMSPSHRREWITRLSKLDVRFATRLYDEVRTTVRDLKGAIKHNETRLGRESEKLLESSEVDKLHERANRLQGDITFLLENRNTNYDSESRAMQRYNEAASELHEISKRVLNMNISHPDMAILRTFDSIVERENSLRNKESADRALLTEAEQNLADVIQTLYQLRSEKAIDLDGLENRLGVLHEAMSKLDTCSEDFSVEGDLTEVIKDTKAVKMPLTDFISTLTGPTLYVPARDTWENISKVYEGDRNAKAACDTRLRFLAERKQTIENAAESNCPKCGYTWKDGISEHDLKTVTAKLNKEIDENGRLAENVLKGEGLIAKIHKRREEIEGLRHLARSYPRLRTLWVYISDMKMLDSEPDSIKTAYVQWEKASMNALHRDSCRREIDEVEDTIKRVKMAGGKGDVDFFVRKEQEYNEKVAKLQLTLGNTIKDLSELKTYKRKYQTIQNLLTDIVKRVEFLEKQQKFTLQCKVQGFIGSQLKTEQIDLSTTTRKVTELKTLTGIVDDLKANLEELKRDYEAQRLLEKALSPLDGVVADAVGGFIDVFIGQLNDLIAMIWEYDMRIIPCGKETGEMDYKFPLAVLSTESVAPDINKGSEGQKEVINYAFTLAVMAYLDLKDYPLFLDELGSAFDEAHRRKLVHFNKHLLESQQCSQIWMISHFITEHGGLSDADTCVLDATNIAVPEVYNEHVVMS